MNRRNIVLDYYNIVNHIWDSISQIKIKQKASIYISFNVINARHFVEKNWLVESYWNCRATFIECKIKRIVERISTNLGTWPKRLKVESISCSRQRRFASRLSWSIKLSSNNSTKCGNRGIVIRPKHLGNMNCRKNSIWRAVQSRNSKICKLKFGSEINFWTTEW